MRSDFLLLLVGSMSIAALCPSCGTAENVPAQADAAAASDAAAKVECPADAGATSSLAGTVETSGFFASMKLAEVSLYAVYPYGTQPSVALTPQNVTPDLSGRAAWSFGCLSAGTHYYLQATGHFKVADAKPASVATIVGPLTVPSIGPALAVRVQPLQVAVLESRSAGTTARQLEWASAHVFDPATGEEISGASTVTIDVGGGAPTPIPWRPDASGGPAYYVQFVQPPVAQPSYTVKATVGAMSISSRVVADPPAFDGAIVSPSDGATLAAGTPLTVLWAAQPQADYELVELFASQQSHLVSVYTSPRPDGPGLTQEQSPIPGTDIAQPGTYLLSVSYAKTNCPRDAGGCVHSNSVSAATLTVK